MDKRVLVISGDVENLPDVYADLKQQFPAKSLHSYEHFEYLLRETGYRMMILERESDHKMIGYCLSCSVMGTGVVWLDYIAIRPEYQGRGYGELLFCVVLNAYREFADGLLFMVEKIDKSRPDTTLSQERRVRFYERLGAKRLQTDFHVPTPQGPYAGMDLFFIPIPNDYVLSARKLEDTLKTVYRLIFGDIDKSIRKSCETLTFPTCGGANRELT